MADDTCVQAEELRQAFHTNLLLLGFDQQSAEVKYKMAFNRDMFVLPNKKAFEVTAYFLFNRLDPVRCREQFRTCWPVFDKTCEAAFRKGCVEWLAQVSKDDADSHLPRIVPSLFLSPGGDKFYGLMHGFSTYVLIQVARRELGLKSTDQLIHPILTPRSLDMGEVMVKTVQCATIRHRARALEHMQTVTGVRETWHTYATELAKDHRELTKKIRERQEDLQSLLKCRKEKGLKTPGRRCAGNTGMASSRLPQYALDADSAKRTEHAHKTRDFWKAMDAFVASKNAEKEIVESVVQEVVASRPSLDAAEFKLAIPDLLLRSCEKELARRNVSNIYKGGKVDLLSLLHLWNLSLHLYFEKFHDGGLLDTRDAVSRLQTKAHVHTAEVKDLQALRSRLVNDVVPDLKKNIADMSKKLDALLFPEECSAPKQASIGFGMLSYTPTATRMNLQDEPVRRQQPGIPSPRVRDPAVTKLSLQLTPGSPEVATRVIRSAVSANSVRPSPLAQGSPVAFTPLMPSSAIPGAGLSPSWQRPLFAAGFHEVASTHVENATQYLPKQSASQQPVSRSGLISSAGSLPSEPGRVKHSKLPRRTAELAATTAARKQLARQMEPDTSNRVNDAVASQARNNGKTAAPKIEPASAKNIAGQRNQLSTATSRADEALADKIVDFVLMGGKEDEDEDPCGMDGPMLTSPGAELGQTAFQSRDLIRRTPPKDVYAHTVQHVAISDDDEEVDIITIESRQDILGVVNETARSGLTYGELFRTYLRDNGILGGRAVSPKDVSRIDDDQTAAGGYGHTNTRANLSDGPVPAHSSLYSSVTEARHPQISSNREALTLAGDSTGGITTRLLEGNDYTSIQDKEMLVKHTASEKAASFAQRELGSSRTVGGDKAESFHPTRTFTGSDSVPANKKGGTQEMPDAAIDRVDRPTAVMSANDPPVTAPDTTPQHGGSKEDDLHARTSRADTALLDMESTVDPFADDTPRAVHFIVGVPPLFPASTMMRLSLTPSSHGSSSFDSPRIVELSDDNAVAEFLKGGATDASSSPTTDDLFKRLQALKQQAALSISGAMHNGNSSFAGDLLPGDAQMSGNSCLFDDDASILNDSLAMSPQPSVSSPPQG